MNKLISKNVRLLLDVAPECRDDDKTLICMYLYHFTNFTASEVIGSPLTQSIERVRRLLQRQYPQLRGQKYQARQKYAKVWAKECVSNEPIRFVKETTPQYIFRIIKRFFKF